MTRGMVSSVVVRVLRAALMSPRSWESRTYLLKCGHQRGPEPRPKRASTPKLLVCNECSARQRVAATVDTIVSEPTS